MGFEQMLNEELVKVSKEIGSRLVKDAKIKHRYQTRSGTLDSAIKQKGDVTEELQVYIDGLVADYGKYIYYGHGTWKADKFLEEVLDDDAEWVIDKIKDAINKAIEKFNRKKR